MKTICGLLLLVFANSAASATPPLAGGFMTGTDMPVIVYWFHPDCHAWEQGINCEGVTYDLFPGPDTGHYAMAQAAAFPMMSFITKVAVEIFPGDHYTDWPGNNNTALGLAVYQTGTDSLPQWPRLAACQDSLRFGGEEPAGWIGGSVAIDNMIGETFWFSLEWNYGTASAPEIRATTCSDATDFNKFGVGDGAQFKWHEFSYVPIMRYRFLTATDADSAIERGWRRPILGSAAIRNFLIRRFDSNPGSTVDSIYRSSDTLMASLPGPSPDSITITACYDDEQNNEPLTLRFEPDRVLPISAEVEYVDFDEMARTHAYDIRIDYTGPETLELLVGCESRLVTFDNRRIKLGTAGPAVISCRVAASDKTAFAIPVILQDQRRAFYPHRVMLSFPEGGPSDIDTAAAILPEHLLEVYPNPVPSGQVVSFSSKAVSGRIEVFNILGERVMEFTLKNRGKVVWDGCDSRHKRLAAGIYLARFLVASRPPETRRVVLLH